MFRKRVYADPAVDPRDLSPARSRLTGDELYVKVNAECAANRQAAAGHAIAANRVAPRSLLAQFDAASAIDGDSADEMEITPLDRAPSRRRSYSR